MRQEEVSPHTVRNEEAMRDSEHGTDTRRVGWKGILGSRKKGKGGSHRESGSDLEDNNEKSRPARWNVGILNDRYTDEVPGSILLLSKVSAYNEPLGLRNQPARTSASSLPSQLPRRSSSIGSFRRHTAQTPTKKLTADGKIILEPQPDDSANDPLNWSVWRRDAALLSLGFYCMVGGGMTPILAAGFTNVAHDYDISHARVALTTGLYMMGLGVGSVVLSPTAILYGKRPVYLVSAVCFILTSVWCALSPNFTSLVVARVFQGVAVSSVECLPSATVAEIYFLHEKAYRLGIYTLLLLGGKNLVPLVSAAIIQSLGWRWVFWIVAIIVGLGLALLFLFVPETFWDRTPRPKQRHRKASISSLKSRLRTSKSGPASPMMERKERPADDETVSASPVAVRHAHFQTESSSEEQTPLGQDKPNVPAVPTMMPPPRPSSNDHTSDYFTHPTTTTASQTPPITPMSRVPSELSSHANIAGNAYTTHYSASPPKTFLQQLKPFSGRLVSDSWTRVAFRPFILFAYPAILWSALVYSLSVGWLIVLSESVTDIYRSSETYNFSALQAGLVYISPFIGGILGTAVAGKVSDIIVRWLSRKNGGIYEPEFRLVMAIPIALTTTIGLMGYGWSAQEHDNFMVPTIFFGIISFGCSLGSTTSITFAVDSYRQYAGEALVTLNFSKNVLHGLVFSLFFNRWLEADGSKNVFLIIGGLQLGLMATTIPMFIFGKRGRMWTVRKGLMERF
jgi:MFS family permease